MPSKGKELMAWTPVALSPGDRQPLYAQVREYLRERIVSGALPPDTSIPPEKTLSELFGVSGISIRRALSDLVQDGLVRRIPGRGSFVCRPPAPDKPVCVIIPEGGGLLTHTFITAMLFGISQALSERGRALMIYTTQTVDYIKDALNHRFCGILLAGHNVPQWEIFLQAQVPFVMFGETDHPQMHTVDIDNVQIGYDQTRHLLDQGCRRPGFLGGRPQGGSLWQARLAGYERALAEIDQAVDSTLLLSTDYSLDSGQRLADTLLQKGVDGLVCVDDMIGYGAIKAALRRGMRVPEDVKIIGCNNSDLHIGVQPELTTIDLNPEAFGRAGAELLLQELAQQPAPRREIVNRHRIVPRGSTVG